MEKLIINSYEEFAAHLGEQLGVSDWLEVDQERINLFADATLDHQWIHVDVEKAKKERLLLVPGSAFGCPGYVRIAYCVSPAVIDNSYKAFEKLAGYYQLK